MDIQKIPYAKEEIEHLVDQIIKLNCEIEKGNFSNELSRSIDILCDALEMIAKPQLIISNEIKPILNNIFGKNGVK